MHVAVPRGDAPRRIAAGDLVVVYEGHDKMKPVYVGSGQFQNRFGAFNMPAWVGLPFGAKASPPGAIPAATPRRRPGTPVPRKTIRWPRLACWWAGDSDNLSRV